VIAASGALIALRHCESSGQAPDAPLTETGYAQAERLAEALASHGITRIVSSPYRRARESALPLAKRLGLEIEIDERLAERRLSSTHIDDWRAYVERSFVEPEARAPGGESGGEALARGWAALHDALRSGRTLIASHGQLLSLVLHRIDARFGFAGRLAMTNPDVFRIERSAAGALHFERLWESAPSARN
jgi:2,3-bisphosphoglycerate-dependent phosphoglycerate mutase